MARPSDLRFVALHELRVRGLAALAGTDRLVLDGLVRDGLVRRHDGVVSGWQLTPAGRVAHDEAVVVDRAGVENDLHDGYLRFLVLNPLLLDLCTDAQLRPDVAVVVRLAALHDRARPVVEGLAGALARFGAYRDRLATALERVQGGDLGFLARPMVDSYHTIWSELHEDLLATLGVARGSEPVVAGGEVR